MLPGGLLIAVGSSLHGAAGSLLMLVGALGAIFGLIYVQLGYTFAVPILVHRRAWGSMALRQSWSLARSQRAPLFLAFLASSSSSSSSSSSPEAVAAWSSRPSSDVFE
ncbi:MAG: hypothetical protein GW913_00235 [Myxococcales bacterium]|nr:hypothetical protein [Myxococcales bacterium]